MPQTLTPKPIKPLINPTPRNPKPETTKLVVGKRETVAEDAREEALD